MVFFAMNCSAKTLILTAVILFTGCTSEEVRRPPYTAPVQQPEPKLATTGMSEEERFEILARLRDETAREFILGQGDVLFVSVYDEPDLTIDGIPVRPDGRISYPLIGDVDVRGKSADKVREEITERLSAFLKEPKVSVLVRQFNSQQYTIMGQVEKPGTFPLDTKVHLTQALARSGGLKTGVFHATTVNIADLAHAFISRNGEMLPIDFVALFSAGDLRYDIPLQSGDYIYIPSGLTQEVYVLGEVNHADMFAYREGMSLTKALVIAKGFSRIADTDRVHVIRGSLTDPELYVVDLDDIYNGHVTDIALEPGDIVFVPPTGLSKWSQIVNQLLPSMVFARTGMQLN